MGLPWLYQPALAMPRLTLINTVVYHDSLLRFARCSHGSPLYSRSLKVGNPIASILKSNVEGIPARYVLNPFPTFWGLL